MGGFGGLITRPFCPQNREHYTLNDGHEAMLSFKASLQLAIQLHVALRLPSIDYLSSVLRFR